MSAGEKPFTRQVTVADSLRISCSRAGGSRYTAGGCLAASVSRDSGEDKGGRGPAIPIRWRKSTGTRREGKGKYLPLGFEITFFCGEGRSLWVTVHTNSFLLSQSSTQTLATPLALKVPLGWLSVSVVLVSSGSPFWEAQEIFRVS